MGWGMGHVWGVDRLCSVEWHGVWSGAVRGVDCGAWSMGHVVAN